MAFFAWPSPEAPGLSAAGCDGIGAGEVLARCWRGLPVKVRLEALLSWTRMAGRATLEVLWAMVEARREARTRVEAIATDGEEEVGEKGW